MSEDREERGAGVDDTLAQRFEDTETTRTDQSSETSKTTDTSKSTNSSSSSELSEASRASEASKTTERAKSGETSEASKTPMSERRQVMFYLTDDQAERLDLVYDEVRLQVKREFGIELEKNRHVRPLVLSVGLDRVAEMDATEIRDAITRRNTLKWPTT